MSVVQTERLENVILKLPVAKTEDMSSDQEAACGEYCILSRQPLVPIH